MGTCIGLPVAVAAVQMHRLGGAGVAKSLGGTPAPSRVVALTHEAAQAVGVSPPANVYVIDKAEPNAFAAGLSSASSTVAVTDGLLNILTDNEVRAVLAHEMGHIAHRDVQRNMHVLLATAGLGGLYEAGRFILRSGGGKKKRRSNKKSDGSASLGFTLMAAGTGAQVAAHLLRLGASRTAELRADHEAAAAFGATPLISALRKIDKHAARHSDLRSSTVGRQMAFTMISNGASQPLVAHSAPTNSLSTTIGRAFRSLKRVLHTHPDLNERIAALESAVESGAVRGRGSSRS